MNSLRKEFSINKVDLIIIEAALKTQLDCLNKMNLNLSKEKEASVRLGCTNTLAKVTLLIGRTG